MTVKNKSSDYICLNEDDRRWAWDYRQIQSFVQPVLLRRKSAWLMGSCFRDLHKPTTNNLSPLKSTYQQGGLMYQHLTKQYTTKQSRNKNNKGANIGR